MFRRCSWLIRVVGISEQGKSEIQMRARSTRANTCCGIRKLSLAGPFSKSGADFSRQVGLSVAPGRSQLLW